VGVDPLHIDRAQSTRVGEAAGVSYSGLTCFGVASDGTYDVRPVNLKMGPVDEKNKELWLRDADFEEIFGMTKAAFKKVPPFKRPLMKKKRRENSSRVGLGSGSKCRSAFTCTWFVSSAA
jgi:hypothetical protein